MNSMKSATPASKIQPPQATFDAVPARFMAGSAAMAKVLLISQAAEDPSDNSFKRGAFTRLQQSAALGSGRHILVDDPAEADIILFAEIHIWFAYNIRHHPYYRQYREKIFAFAQDDYLIPMVPGVYPSLQKRWYSPRRTRAGFYLSILENPYAEFDPAPVARDLLFSFVGSTRTWEGRARLMTIPYPHAQFVDTAQQAHDTVVTQEQREIYWKRYADIARRSQFVLCPRGEGSSSIRLFEMMRMGRAPVIISDEWVPPEGPRWDECCIRIAEADLMRIPEILQARAHEAEAIGLRARQEWERWFAPEVVFDTVVDWCLEIKEARRLPEWLAHLMMWPQIFRPYFFRAYLRFWKNKIERRRKRLAAARGK